MNYLICAKLKEIVKLQDIIKKDDLNYNQNAENLVILVNIPYLLFFKRYS